MTNPTDAAMLRHVVSPGNRAGVPLPLAMAAVVTLLCATWPASTGGRVHGQSPEPATPTVFGKLLAPDGSAAAGFEVRLVPSPASYARRLGELGENEAIPVVDRVSSDQRGRFHLSAPRAGPYRLEILAAASDTTPATVVAPVYTSLLPLAEPTALPPIRLPEMHRLVIGVTDEAGEPVPRAQVVAQATQWSDRERRSTDPTLLQPGRPWERPQQPRTPPPIDPVFGRAAARTDAQGVAHFYLPTPDANVFVYAAGFELRASVVKGSGRYQLRRDPGVTFRVTDPGGTPVSGAVIRVAENLAIPLALTDEHGEATVGLNAGEAIPFQIETANRGFGRTDPVRIPEGDDARPHLVEVKVTPAVEVSGQVVDAETGLAIEGASIWLRGRPGDHAWSGPDGAVRLSTRPGLASLHVSAAATGYRTEGTEVPLERRQRGAGFSIALMPTARINGIVTDSDGDPVAGASILVDRFDPGQSGVSLGSSGTSYQWRAAYGLDHQTRSDSDGTFRLTGLDRRLSHLLTVEAQGFVRSSSELPGVGSTTALDPLRIVLSRGRRIGGEVVDAQGRPVEGASVVLVPAVRNPRGGTSLSYDSYVTAATDADGLFEIPAIAGGNYHMIVDHVEFQSRPPTSVDIPGDEGDTDIGRIRLTPGLQIEGLVVGSQGRPIAGAEVAAFQGYAPRGPTGEGSRTAITDAGGSFRIGGLPDGRVEVTAAADGYAESHLKGVDPAADDMLEIELNRGATLTGRVVDSRGDAVAATVTLFDAEPGPFAGFHPGVQTDAEGRFRFDLLRPGTWRTSAFAFTSGGRTESTPIHLRTGEVREIELVVANHDGQVIGVVTDHLGNPVDQTEVTITTFDGGSQPGSSWTTPVDPRGRFQSQPVPTGTARIVASHPEYRETEREITIDPGTNEVSLVLEPGLEISGSVRSSDGRPIPLAAVSAELDLSPEALQQFMSDPSNRARRGTSLQPVEALTDRNGDFRLGGLDDGVYKLTAWADGYGSGEAVGRQVRLEGGSAAGLDIILPAQATITIQIAGEPLPGLHVDVRQGLSDFRTATQDTGGDYRIEGLGPGDWIVTARQEDGRSAQQTVSLVPGDEIVVELRFEEGLHVTGWVTVGGQSADGGDISLFHEGVQPRWTDLDRDGRFELPGVLPGTYTLIVGIPGAVGLNAGASYSRRVELLGDQELRVDLEAPAVLAGLILDGEGRPLAGALVSTVETGSGGDVHGSAVRFAGAAGGRAITDIDGKFELQSAPGSFDLLVASEGLGHLTVPVELAPGEYRQGLVFELRPATRQQP